MTLSFDNGPRAGVTEAVLDTLAEHGVRATFFVVGQDLERPGARAIVERAVAEGHWVGNHTTTHTVLFGEHDDPRLPEREVGATQAALGPLAHRDRLFRPYAGGGVLGPHVLSPALVHHLVEGGYTLVLWNCVPRDWERPDAWVGPCLEDVRTRPWSLVVLHDLDTGAMRHLGTLLARLREEGIGIVQELPEACVPIRRGEVVGDLAGLLPSGAAGS